MIADECVPVLRSQTRTARFGWPSVPDRRRAARGPAGIALVPRVVSSVMTQGKRVLVTGGAGFVGATLVRQLVERGHAVRVYDNFTTGTAAHLDGVEAEQVRGDIRDAQALDAAVTGIFLVLVATVLVDSIRSWVSILSGARECESHETTFVLSQMPEEA